MLLILKQWYLVLTEYSQNVCSIILQFLNWCQPANHRVWYAEEQLQGTIMNYANIKFFILYQVSKRIILCLLSDGMWPMTQWLIMWHLECVGHIVTFDILSKCDIIKCSIGHGYLVKENILLTFYSSLYNRWSRHLWTKNK